MPSQHKASDHQRQGQNAQCPAQNVSPGKPFRLPVRDGIRIFLRGRAEKPLVPDQPHPRIEQEKISGHDRQNSQKREGNSGSPKVTKR